MNSYRLLLLTVLVSNALASPRLWHEYNAAGSGPGPGWGSAEGPPAYSELGGASGNGPPLELIANGAAPGWNSHSQAPSFNFPTQLPAPEMVVCQASTIYSTILSTVAGPASVLTIPGPTVTVQSPNSAPYAPGPPAYVTLPASTFTVYPPAAKPSTVQVTAYATLTVVSSYAIIETSVVTTTEACSFNAPPASQQACATYPTPGPGGPANGITATFGSPVPSEGPKTITMAGEISTVFATVTEACSKAEQAASPFTVTMTAFQTVTTTEQHVMTVVPTPQAPVFGPTVIITKVESAAAGAGYTLTVTEKQTITAAAFPAPAASSCEVPAAQVLTTYLTLTTTSTYYETGHPALGSSTAYPTPISFASPGGGACESTVFMTVHAPATACLGPVSGPSSTGPGENKPSPPAYAVPSKSAPRP